MNGHNKLLSRYHKKKESERKKDMKNKEITKPFKT